MLVAITKELAEKLNLELKYTRSQSSIASTPLDDWVMGLAFDEPKEIGIFLIHTNSMFTLFVVSDEYDMLELVDLFYDQLITILINNGLKAGKYRSYFDKLFSQIVVSRHDNRSVSSAIGYFKEHLFDFELPAIFDENKLLDSIDMAIRINNIPRKKFNFQNSLEIFTDLVKKHYNDPVVHIIDENQEI